MAKDRTIRLPEPDFLPKRTRSTMMRDTRYEEKYNHTIFYLALLGLTEQQMAQVLGISLNVITLWKDKHPVFADALRRGKTEADGKVVFSLYQAAVGYKHKKTVVLTNRVQEFDEHGRVIKQWTEPLLVDVEEHFPPNVTACIKWLQARQPGVWSDRLHIDGKINVSHQIDLTDFTTEELQVLSRLGVNSGTNGKHVVEDVAYEEN